MMRVAHVVASYYPRVGGVETHVRRIAEACARAGDDVTVLTHATQAAPRRNARFPSRAGWRGLARHPGEDEVSAEKLGGVLILRFRETVPSVRYPLSLPLFRYLAGRAADYDVVHAHSYHTLVGHAAASSGLPFVFTPHYHGTGHTWTAVLMHRAYRPVGARVLANADAVICVSEAERGLIVTDFPAVARKTRVIPNGADLPADLPAGGDGSARPVLLTVGRLERYKNVDLIIKAFGEVRTAADLVIVGDGPDRARLEPLARHIAGSTGGRVRFTGRVSDAELGRLLAAAAAVTSASDHEAFGLVVADGLTAGARVVASAIPAHHEIGRLAGAGAPITYVNPRDTGAFATALDAALSAGKASAGRAWLPSWTEVAERTRELYAAVAARDSVPGSRPVPGPRRRSP